MLVAFGGLTGGGLGGAIAGALGGLVFGVNVGVYKSSLPGIAKPFLNILTGAAAIGIWYAIARAMNG